MKRTFFHCTSSRSASAARRSRSDVWRAISGRSSSSSSRRSSVIRRAATRAACDGRQVRIAPDRRGEVRVALGRQAEVADVRRVVARLLHRAQHQERDRLLLRRAAHRLDQLLEVARLDGVRRRAEAVAERRDELLELLDLERVGLLVDAVERRHVVVVEVLRDRLVGDQHELLDQPMRDVALGRDDRLDHPLVVEDDLGFLQVEVDRAAAAAPLVEDLEQLAASARTSARGPCTSAIGSGSRSVRIALTSV